MSESVHSIFCEETPHSFGTKVPVERKGVINPPFAVLSCLATQS